MASFLAARCPSTLTASLRLVFLRYFALIAVAWLPWLVIAWPGAMRDDTLAQYLQVSGIHQYYTQHPLFDTLIFGLFWHAGSAVAGTPLAGQAAYIVIQAVLLAAGAAFTLCYIRKLGAPRWLVILSLLYLATSYVVAGSIITMGKDSLHTVFFVPFAVMFVEACLTRGAVLARQPVAITFVALAFAVIASKRTALVIVLCAGCCLLAACRGNTGNGDADGKVNKDAHSSRLRDGARSHGRPFVSNLERNPDSDQPRDHTCGRQSPESYRGQQDQQVQQSQLRGRSGDQNTRQRPQPRAQQRPRRPLRLSPRFRAFVCLAAAVILAQGVWAPLAAAATHANLSPGREVWGLVTQPVAQVAHDHPNDRTAITPDQRRSLNAIMNLDQAAADINPHRTNETFQTLREHPQPTTAQKLAALRVWAELGVAHPGEYAKAYAGPIRGWWDMSVNFAYPTDSDYLFTRGYLKQWSTFLPETVTGASAAGGSAAGTNPNAGTGSGAGTGADAAANGDDDADIAAAQRIVAIEHDLAPLMGTSRKPHWKRTVLDDVRHWVRDDNPLTAMGLYVTWIPLIIGAALLLRMTPWRRMTRRRRSPQLEQLEQPGQLGRINPSSRARQSYAYDVPAGIASAGIASAGIASAGIASAGIASAGIASAGIATADIPPAAPVPADSATSRTTAPRPASALAAYGLLFFTILSLYASPEALFWYPIPVYFTLPLFSALLFARACRAEPVR
ncbi:hypothetical protein BMYO_1416 [Bifidobacterium myosotis]|uniref:Sortase B cell surface sorting signal n=2 Tax=Bifidobacterium myosotis TaxID=1630166 RepID=A0A261FJ76_9BIFI|nr:hypothetical protein BMYO_1416 [Bifidobacterium myosotis]